MTSGGNISSFTDAEGTDSEFTYGPRNALTALSIANAAAGATSLTWQYDVMGRPVQSEALRSHPSAPAQDFSIITNHGYNTLGLPEYESFTIDLPGSAPQYFITHAAYNQHGHVDSMQYPSANGVSHAYDNLGRISTMTDPQ